jgi:hypothetical protein
MCQKGRCGQRLMRGFEDAMSCGIGLASVIASVLASVLASVIGGVDVRIDVPT